MTTKADDSASDELTALYAKLSELKGPSNKKKRNRVNQQIREIKEDRSRDAAVDNKNTNRCECDTNDVAEATDDEANIVLHEASLPPFQPTREVVETATVPNTALIWAFVINVPTSLRPVFLRGTNRGTHTSPAAQWNYSMFHLAHHFQSGVTRFILEDDGDKDTLLLEVTSVKACPDSQGAMKELAREDYVCPLDNVRLGAVPIFFVRYLHTCGPKSSHKAWRSPTSLAAQFCLGGPIMKICSASPEEVQYGHSELQRKETWLPSSSNPKPTQGSFRRSVVFPAALQELLGARQPKADYVCSMCNASVADGNRLRCSRCRVTFYCGRDCQREHWSRHKRLCQPAARDSNTEQSCSNDAATTRPNFCFVVKAGRPGSRFVVSQSHISGALTASGMTKEQRESFKAGSARVQSAPTPRNVKGEQEFIVKIQPPVTHDPSSEAWMCYDGPTRSFQCYIPPETEHLVECYEKVQRDGIPSMNPVLRIPGYKAYCWAKWEGNRLRVFFDRFAPTQTW